MCVSQKLFLPINHLQKWTSFDWWGIWSSEELSNSFKDVQSLKEKTRIQNQSCHSRQPPRWPHQVSPPSVHTLHNAHPVNVDCTYWLSAHEKNIAEARGYHFWYWVFHLGLVLYLSLSQPSYWRKQAAILWVALWRGPKCQGTFTYMANSQWQHDALNPLTFEELNLANSHGSELGRRFSPVWSLMYFSFSQHLDFSLMRDPTSEVSS